VGGDGISNSGLFLESSGIDRDEIVGINNVPEDVFMFHIVGYPNQVEVVGGLSETNKLYSALIRNRCRIEVKMYPDEILNDSPGVWKILQM
jgi:hypothetical protein